jgi:alpha-tubulin suppressor-like RCC1 family protein
MEDPMADLLSELEAHRLTWIEILIDVVYKLPTVSTEKLTLIVPTNDMYQKWARKSPMIKGLMWQLHELEELEKVPDILLCSIGNMTKRGKFRNKFADYDVGSQHVDGRLRISRTIETSYGTCIVIHGILSTELINRQLDIDESKLSGPMLEYWASLPQDLFVHLIKVGKIRNLDLFSLCVSNAEINAKCNANDQEIFRYLLEKQYRIKPKSDEVSARRLYFNLQSSSVHFSGALTYRCNKRTISKIVAPHSVRRLASSSRSSQNYIVLLHGGGLLVSGENTTGNLGFPPGQRINGKYTFIKDAADKNVSIKEVVLAATFSIFIDFSGQMWGAGTDVGQYGPFWNDRLTFPRVTPQDHKFTLNPYFHNVKKITCGDSFFCFIVGETPWISGMKLSNAKKAQVYRYPKALPHIIASDIAAGLDHVIIVETFGTVWTLGSNEYGQLGREDLKAREGVTDYESRRLDLPFKAKSVACGASSSFLIDANHQLWACGRNTLGALGLASKNDMQSTFTRVPLDVKVRKVSSGMLHTGVVDENWNVWTTGWNNCGQLARPGNDSLVFQKINNERYNDILCAGSHTMLLGKTTY